MRSMINRQRVATAAVLAASATILAACGPQKQPTSTPSTDSSATAVPSHAPIAARAGTILISNGTANVIIGKQTVVFPTTVTDASWSPDGSRIAFVDGDGNISVSRPDGSSRVIITKLKPGVTRSRPVWGPYLIEFAEKDAKGASRLMNASPNGLLDQWATDEQRRDGEWQEWIGGDDIAASVSAPTRAALAGRGEQFAQLAFEHQASGGNEVWILDANQREPSAAKVAKGTEPAVSPDGTHIAYVAPNGQVAVSTVTGKPVQVTFGAVKPAHLAWSVDGKQIAYSTATGIESVAAAPASKNANPATRLASAPGVASFLIGTQDRVDRISAADPIDAAIAVSQSAFVTRKSFMLCECDSHWAFGVVLGATDNPLAVLDEGGEPNSGRPLLLTAHNKLDPRVKTELKRLFGTVKPEMGKPMITLSAKLDASVRQELVGMGYDVEIASARPDTANVDRVILVSGKDRQLLQLADTFTDGAMVLTDGDKLSSEAQKLLLKTQAETKLIVLGRDADNALAHWSGRPQREIVRLVGNDAVETAGVAAQWRDSGPHTIIVVDPASERDVTTAIEVARIYGAPLLFVKDGNLPASVLNWIDISSAQLGTVIVVDGGKRVPNQLSITIGSLSGGPTGYTTSANPKRG